MRGSSSVAAPMSFAGSYERTMGLSRRLGRGHWVAQAAGFMVAAMVLAVWWTAIICWYILFGVCLVPYRVIRRGQRKRRLAAAQHAELLAALSHKPRV